MFSDVKRMILIFLSILVVIIVIPFSMALFERTFSSNSNAAEKFLSIITDLDPSGGEKPEGVAEVLNFHNSAKLRSCILVESYLSENLLRNNYCNFSDDLLKVYSPNLITSKATKIDLKSRKFKDGGEEYIFDVTIEFNKKEFDVTDRSKATNYKSVVTIKNVEVLVNKEGKIEQTNAKEVLKNSSALWEDNTDLLEVQWTKI